MWVKLEKAGGQYAQLLFTGRLDAAGAAAAEKNLPAFLAAEAEKPRPVLLDFSQIDFVGSVGMRFLLRFSKKLQERGQILLIAGVSQPIEQALRVAGFDKVLAIVPDLTRAAAAIMARLGGKP